MRRRRPVLGIISGVVFGFSAALSLALFGLVPIDSVLLTVVLVLGIALGVVVGLTAPLARLRSGATGAGADAAVEGARTPEPEPATPATPADAPPQAPPADAPGPAAAEDPGAPAPPEAPGPDAPDAPPDGPEPNR